MADLIDFTINMIPHPTMPGITLRECSAVFDLGCGKRTMVCCCIPPEVQSARQIAEYLLDAVNEPWPPNPNELL